MKIRKIINPKSYQQYKNKIKNLESDMNSTRRSKARDATSLHSAMKSTPLISPIPQSYSHLRFYSEKKSIHHCNFNITNKKWNKNEMKLTGEIQVFAD